jgi:hypothetical protein
MMLVSVMEDRTLDSRMECCRVTGEEEELEDAHEL